MLCYIPQLLDHPICNYLLPSFGFCVPFLSPLNSVGIAVVAAAAAAAAAVTAVVAVASADIEREPFKMYNNTNITCEFMSQFITMAKMPIKLEFNGMSMSMQIIECNSVLCFT